MVHKKWGSKTPRHVILIKRNSLKSLNFNRTIDIEVELQGEEVKEKVYELA
jgi:hypothetical protein